MNFDYPQFDVAHQLDPTVRPFVIFDTAGQGDKAFVCATWANSYQGKFVGQLSKYEYKRCQYTLIEAVLAFPTTQVFVVRSAEEPTSVLAFAALDEKRKVLHYMYCKFEYRKNALCQNLVLGRGLRYLSMSPGYRLPQWASHLYFHPYILDEVFIHYGSEQQKRQHQQRQQHQQQQQQQPSGVSSSSEN